MLRNCRCVCVRVCVCVGNFPLELNDMGLEEKLLGKPSPLSKSLALGRSQGTPSFWQQVRVIHTHDSGWRVQCVVFVCLFLYLFYKVFHWKLHTGINRSSRSSLGRHTGKVLGTGALSSWSRSPLQVAIKQADRHTHRSCQPQGSHY